MTMQSVLSMLPFLLLAAAMFRICSAIQDS